jgi:hypothetical protein
MRPFSQKTSFASETLEILAFDLLSWAKMGTADNLSNESPMSLNSGSNFVASADLDPFSQFFLGKAGWPQKDSLVLVEESASDDVEPDDDGSVFDVLVRTAPELFIRRNVGGLGNFGLMRRLI